MPATIATIIAVSTEAMILFHSKDDIGVLPAPPTPAAAVRAAENPDSRRQLNRIITLSAMRRTGHVVAARLPHQTLADDRDANRPANPIVMIPARLAATRLPDKPLAEIAGVPMIVHVWRRAVAAGVGPVVVACGDREIAEAVEAAGGRAVMTDPAAADRLRPHPRGDRRARSRPRPRRGDQRAGRHADARPGGDPRRRSPALADPDTDIATLAAPIDRPGGAR